MKSLKLKLCRFLAVRAGLVKLSVILRWPCLTALLFAACSETINRKGKGGVLCIAKPIFVDDVKAMAKYSGLLRYELVPAILLRIVCHSFMKKESWFNHTGYHQLDNAEEKLQYHTYLSTMLLCLWRILSIKSVLSGNYVYSYQQELAMVCERENTPFLILHKEGIAVPGSYGRLVDTYTNHLFVGRKMLLYNRLMKDALLDKDIPGLTPDKLDIVGVPRLDAYSQERMPVGSAIVFFSFWPQDKFRYLIDEKDGVLKRVEQRSLEFHRFVMQFAETHGDIKVVIKTKANRRYLDYVTEILENSCKSNPSNLTITNSIPAETLIRNAHVVMGFNSTTLIEGLMAGRKLVQPYFGDILQDMSHEYFHKYPCLVKYVRTYDELEQAFMTTPEDEQEFHEKREQFLTELVWKPDGCAGKRAERAILSTIACQE